MKKLIIPASKPRNPLVALAKLRSNAGAHRRSRKAERQRAQRELQGALKNPADSAGFFMVLMKSIMLLAHKCFMRLF